jgi:hypothetical protein
MRTAARTLARLAVAGSLGLAVLFVVGLLDRRRNRPVRLPSMAPPLPSTPPSWSGTTGPVGARLCDLLDPVERMEQEATRRPMFADVTLPAVTVSTPPGFDLIGSLNRAMLDIEIPEWLAQRLGLEQRSR